MTAAPEKPTGARHAIAVLEKDGQKTGFVAYTGIPRKARRKVRAEQRHGMTSRPSAPSVTQW